MDLHSYFTILRRRWWVIVLCVVVGASIGVTSTFIDTSSGAAAKSGPRYKATHTLLLNNTDSSSTFPSAFQSLDQMAVLATTGPVPDAVAKETGSGESGIKLAERITTLTNGTSNTLGITAIATDPADATKTADAFADQLVKYISATDLARYNQANKDASDRLDGIQKKIDGVLAQLAAAPTSEVLQAQLRALENQYTQAYADFEKVASQQAPTSALATLQKAEAVPISGTEYDTRLTQGELGQNNLQVGGVAQVATAASSGSSGLNGKMPRGVLGGLLGLLAGIGLAVLLERLDHRIRTRSGAEHAFGLPVLAEVPSISPEQQRTHEIVSFSQPMSRVAEAYRSVRSAVLFQRASEIAADGSAGTASGSGSDHLFEPAERSPLVIMVTSASPKEGKTTSSANLAAVFAETGASVVVVNCDFRRPMIHKYFGVRDEPRKVHRTPIERVKVITNVTDEEDPNPAPHVVGMQRQLLNAARGQFDVIVLDTAPVLSANDAIDLIADVDFVVVVSRVNVSTAPSAKRAMELLDRVEAPVLGLLLTESTERHSEYYEYYQRSEGNGATPAGNGNGNGANGSPEAQRLGELPPFTLSDVGDSAHREH